MGGQPEEEREGGRKGVSRTNVSCGNGEFVHGKEGFKGRMRGAVGDSIA